MSEVTDIDPTAAASGDGAANVETMRSSGAFLALAWILPVTMALQAARFVAGLPQTRSVDRALRKPAKRFEGGHAAATRTALRQTESAAIVSLNDRCRRPRSVET